ncbi:MAG: BREX system P-loop protein BrxC [Candidatus Xenobium sp.]|nr:BREX system P-loop protein BrxC [Burkholderiales bacterium]
MLIQEIFASDITRDIAPVVYFHEKDPERVQEEVREYIITGGYPQEDPRHNRVPDGIHEQMKHLLRAIRSELERPGGPELPNCWISGFFGSGKSSFAKLLGLALDGMLLPDDTRLAEALLARDTSPLAGELRAAWQELLEKVDPLAVVFDIGAVAREDEHIHLAARRQLQERLGYCPTSDFVADHELKLERDGRWEEFLACAQETLDRPWSEAMNDFLAEDHFSEIMHRLKPTLYTEPTSWLDTRVGGTSGSGTSVDETVRGMEAMLRFRGEGRTLFFVVDEVSQYVFQSDSRQLALQSLAEALGQRLRGRVWLLATGQQKLDEDLEGGNLSKLKDRFPPRLRVHLAATNIRDVVHRRLLCKKKACEADLLRLFEQHRADLKLYGYSCEAITELDFLEVYPMLPGHVDLLMQITTSLRVRSSRMKGDDQAIRGLLQLLGEIFREQDLGLQPLGHLLTLEHIYNAQHTALDADVQNSLARLRAHPELGQDEVALRAAKAVALLELVQDQQVTTSELVARCLYDRLGAGNQVDLYRDALERLREAGFLSLSERQGYRIMSSLGQEWANEREAQSVSGQALSEVVIEKLKDLLGRGLERPKYKGRSFPLAATFSDRRVFQDERLVSPNDLAVMALDFQYLPRREDRRPESWVKESGSDQRRNRLVWVSASPSHLEPKLRELVRSRKMVASYEGRLQGLSEPKRRLLYDEQTRRDSLENEVRALVAELFVDGALYFQSRVLNKDRHPASFAALLQGASEEVLPSLYPHYLDIAITDSEMKQLLQPALSGLSGKFLAGQLGIVEIEGGRYTVPCSGEVPSRIANFLEQERGATGTVLIQHFGGPPCGYPPDVVRACVLGLLRSGKIRIQPETGKEITSVQDPGVQDLFLKDRDFKRAEIRYGGGEAIRPQDRVAICHFFEDSLGVEVERENEAIADAVAENFQALAERLRELEGRLNRLPRRPALPVSLEKLHKSLEACLRPHHVQARVLAVKNNLDPLRDGIQQLGILHVDLTEELIRKVREAEDVRAVHLAQLLALERTPELEEAAQVLADQLDSERPWRDIGSLKETLEAIRARYAELRLELIERAEREAGSRRERVKLREGFNRLTPEQVEHVLRPFRMALGTPDPKAVQPALSTLREVTTIHLPKAETKADQELDRFIEDMDRVRVVTLRTELRGRELSTPAEVDMLLEELRERLLDQLKSGKVRIRLE